MLKQDLKPRDIMTYKAFENAIVSVMALGGSTNAVLHFIAMARCVWGCVTCVCVCARLCVSVSHVCLGGWVGAFTNVCVWGGGGAFTNFLLLLTGVPRGIHRCQCV